MLMLEGPGLVYREKKGRPLYMLMTWSTREKGETTLHVDDDWTRPGLEGGKGKPLYVKGKNPQSMVYPNPFPLLFHVVREA